jgi:hypothetical protein
LQNLDRLLLLGRFTVSLVSEIQLGELPSEIDAVGSNLDGFFQGFQPLGWSIRLMQSFGEQMPVVSVSANLDQLAQILESAFGLTRPQVRHTAHHQRIQF